MQIRSITTMVRGGLARLAVFLRFEVAGLLSWWRVFDRRDDEVRRIAFFSYATHLSQMYKPIMDELRKQPSVEIFFVACFHPFYGLRGLHDMHAYATDELGVPGDKVLFSWQATWLRFDAVITNDVYCSLPIPRSRRILVPHGMGFTPRKVIRSPLRKTIYDFDHIFFAGDLDYSLARPYLARRHRAHVVGFPFVDELADEPVDDSPQAPPKTVLLAPSWLTAGLLGEESHVLFDEIVEAVLATDAYLIIKLHAVAFNDLQTRGLSWNDALAKHRGNSRVEIAVGDDDHPYLRRADVLITDISARAFSFMILDRPVLLLKVPGYESAHPLLARIQQEMNKAAVVFEQPEDLKTLLPRSFEMPMELSAARGRVVSHVLRNLGSAAGANVRAIMEIVDAAPVGGGSADGNLENHRCS